MINNKINKLIYIILYINNEMKFNKILLNYFQIFNI